MSKLISPLRRPQEFGFRPGDTHLVVNATKRTVKAFNYGGQLLWERPCLADGQHPNWRANSGDTPPGLYRLGVTYNDYAEAVEDYGTGTPPMTRNRRSYGWCSFDLVDLEGNEDGTGRAGIMLHGGGSVLGWPGAWAARQPLVITLGCLRMENQDLLELVLPLTKKGTVYVSVHQDDA